MNLKNWGDCPRIEPCRPLDTRNPAVSLTRKSTLVERTQVVERTRVMLADYEESKYSKIRVLPGGEESVGNASSLNSTPCNHECRGLQLLHQGRPGDCVDSALCV